LALLIPATSFSQDITSRWVSECTFSKEVNGDSAVEFLLKSTISIADSFDIKLGVSEGYLAKRPDKYNFNHAGVRLDIGFLWDLADFKVGYTHSARKWFEGSYDSALFNYRDIDTVTLRKEF
jgi:hypothetical protein